VTIDAFIFDFDGVLVDTTTIQVSSLKAALLGTAGVSLTHPNEWEIMSSTITTRAKLQKFANSGKIAEAQIEEIYTAKKKIANEMMLTLNPNDYHDKIEMFEALRAAGKKIAIVTNANGESTRLLLDHLGFTKYLDTLITNSDVNNAKPHPEPYIRALVRLGLEPDRCIIFEDSTVGLLSARATGARVQEIQHVDDVSIEYVLKAAE
jgi:HAD superfamily hydrolase (TIGR01509 family)